MKLPRKTREGETTRSTPKVGASEDSTTRGEAEKPKAEEAKTTACSRDVEKTCSRDARTRVRVKKQAQKDFDGKDS